MTGEINAFRAPLGITANVIKTAGADTLKKVFAREANGKIISGGLIPTSEIKNFGVAQSNIGKTIFAFLNPEATMEDAKKAFDEASRNLDFKA